MMTTILLGCVCYAAGMAAMMLLAVALRFSRLITFAAMVAWPVALPTTVMVVLGAAIMDKLDSWKRGKR